MAAPQELHLTQGPPESVARFNAIIDALWDHADIGFGNGLREFRWGLRRTVYATAQGGTVSAAAASHPWQFFPSLWQGTGKDPNAADRKMRFRIMPGALNSRKASNMSEEFLAFGDPTDTAIEYEDAVVTYVYLQVPVAETALGSGDLLVSRPTVMTVEGAASDDLVGLIGQPPNGGSDGSLPAYLIISLGEIWYYGGGLTFYPGYFSNLTLNLLPTVQCGSVTRVFQLFGTQ